MKFDRKRERAIFYLYRLSLVALVALGPLPEACVSRASNYQGPRSETHEFYDGPSADNHGSKLPWSFYCTRRPRLRGLRQTGVHVAVETGGHAPRAGRTT